MKLEVGDFAKIVNTRYVDGLENTICIITGVGNFLTRMGNNRPYQVSAFFDNKIYGCAENQLERLNPIKEPESLYRACLVENN